MRGQLLRHYSLGRERSVDIDDAAAFGYTGNSSVSNVGDEFSGLFLRPQRQAGPNRFTIDALGLLAITAINKEALEDYNEPLLDYDFVDNLHPENPVRITMHAEIAALFSEKTKRSTVLWTINAVAVEMMRRRYLRPLPFSVYYHDEHLYTGLVTLKNQPAALDKPTANLSISTRASPPLSSLTMAPVSPTSVTLKEPSSSVQFPHYDFFFNFIQSQSSILSEFRFFETLLATSLQLAKSDPMSAQPRISTGTREVQAWVVIREVRPPMQAYHLQQYHALAVIEMIARHCVLYHQYRELTFQLWVNGYVLAVGCVTKALQYRQWCGRMFPDNYFGHSNNFSEVAAMI
ncbi:MAG: hypothetical protein Q9179_006761 [Wetmoreana sp. 5 TL-2023]